MISVYLNNIFRFVILILLQVFVFDNIRLGGYMNPNIYVLFILLLPFNISGWVLLSSSFFLGFFTDIFYNTMGMHSAACVLMAFLRPFALKIYSPKDGYESGVQPGIKYYGLSWFLKYSVSLIFVHHFFLFTLEVFRLDEFHHTFLRIILSSVLTIVIIVLSQYLIYRK